MSITQNKIKTQDIELLAAFETARGNLAPLYGEALKIMPLSDCRMELHKAFTKQWEPILSEWDKDKDNKFVGHYYRSLFAKPNEHTQPRKNFNVAVWHGDYLCGVAAGGFEDWNENNFSFTSVHVIQGNPDPRHPLKGHVGKIIHEAAIEYAMSLNNTKIAYIGPFSDGAEKIFEKLGLKIEELFCIGKPMAYTCDAPFRKLSIP